MLNVDLRLVRRTVATVKGQVVGLPANAPQMIPLSLTPKGMGPGSLMWGNRAFPMATEGKFEFKNVPAGSASVWIHKKGYVRLGLGPKITTPAKDVDLQMYPSAQLIVTVAFAAVARDGGYIVNIEPEGGGGVGTWGGSGNIDNKNQITFKDVPPGKYVLHGRPNPGSEK